MVQHSSYTAPHALHVAFLLNHPATTDIYTLSLHDALPISRAWRSSTALRRDWRPRATASVGTEVRERRRHAAVATHRSEEHTSELQSRQYLVCRLLLEKKKRRRRAGSRYQSHRR